MEERSTHLTIVVGASTIAEELRRSLVRHGVAHAGVASHIRGVRRSLVLGENDLVVVCIALDQPTLARHGQSLRQLLADHRCFPKAVRSVGLLTEVGLTSDAAEIGCDVYVHDSQQAAKTVRLLARRWRDQHAKSSSKRSRSRSSHQNPQRDTWVWGQAQLPIEFVPLASSSERQDSVHSTDSPRQPATKRRSKHRRIRVDEGGEKRKGRSSPD